MKGRPCLYCETLEFPKTKEHVLPRSFGANLTIEADVCYRCNTEVFGPLDQTLVEHMRNLVPGTPMLRPAGFFQATTLLHFDEESELWLTMRMRQDGQPLLFPHLIEVGPDKMRFVVDEDFTPDVEDMFARFGQELADAETRFESWVVNRPDEGLPPPQRALIRSRRKAYVVRACSEADADALIDAVRTPRFVAQFADVSNLRTGAEPPRTRSIEQPWVHASFDVPIGDIERALTKIGMNAVCAVCPDTARHPCFRAARRFALEGFGTDEERFVEHEWGARARAVLPPPLPLGRVHTLCLHHLVEEVGPMVSVALYGKPIATVRLITTEEQGASQSPIAPGVFVLWEFDPENKQHQVWTSLRSYVASRRELLNRPVL